jgi:hypothetical protein
MLSKESYIIEGEKKSQYKETLHGIRRVAGPAAQQQYDVFNCCLWWL